MSGTTEAQLTITLSATDWQLVNAMLQQALQPYQRLAQVIQEMQKQALKQQVQSLQPEQRAS